MATKIHDIKVTIANRRDGSFSVAESKKDRVEFKKNVKFSKSSIKEVMTVSKVELVWIIERTNTDEKRSAPLRTTQEVTLF